MIPVTREEKELLERCKTKSEFDKEYIKSFGSKFDPMKLPSRVNNVWYCRDRHMKELEADRKADHTILVPREIKTKANGDKRESFPDSTEILIKISHLLAESLQVQKETYAMFEKLSSKGP